MGRRVRSVMASSYKMGSKERLAVGGGTRNGCEVHWEDKGDPERNRNTDWEEWVCEMDKIQIGRAHV